MARKSKATEEEAKDAKISDTIRSVMETTRKIYGDEIAGTLEGEHSLQAPAMEAIPTGSIALDRILGIGGYPKGRIIEAYGAESSGKSTLALHAVANVQKAGGLAGYIDAEHALDPQYASALGVKLDEMLLSQPNYGEQALNLLETWVETGKFTFIVIDSVAALVPQAELDGEMGDMQVGLQARLMSKALRKLTAKAHKHNCTLFFINQIRMKIGVTYGSPKTTPGGNALKFYASVRLEISRTGSIKKGDATVANKTRVKVVKNKVAPPFGTCEFEIFFGQGIGWAAELIDMSVAAGLVKKSGGWYKYEDRTMGLGITAAGEWLEQNPDVIETLKASV